MHLLVVEDDARIAGFVADGFRRDGHTVTCAVDGEEGLYFAQSGAFDAIVLDILLPKLNGLELLRRLRGSGLHYRIQATASHKKTPLALLNET